MDGCWIDTREINFDYLERLLEVELPEKTRVVAICNGESGVLVGIGNYNGYDCEVFSASVGKRPPFRIGMRYCRWYCFGVCGVNRITSRILADNKQALRLNLLLGFTQEGIIRQGDYLTGKDLIITSLLREETEYGKEKS